MLGLWPSSTISACQVQFSCHWSFVLLPDFCSNQELCFLLGVGVNGGTGGGGGMASAGIVLSSWAPLFQRVASIRQVPWYLTEEC